MPIRKNQKAEKTPADTGVHRIAPDRDIVGPYVNDLAARFAEEISSPDKQPVALDLSAVKQMDSRGIALCIGLFKECQAKGNVFSILAPPDLCRFFRTVKLTKIIDIREGASA
jgi:ABC-type transporter Mla MlaB component